MLASEKLRPGCIWSGKHIFTNKICVSNFFSKFKKMDLVENIIWAKI